MKTYTFGQKQMDYWERQQKAASDMLAIVRRWAALDGGAWHVQRHAAEKAELLADTQRVIAAAEAAGIRVQE